jgi:hypothetical protein
MQFLSDDIRNVKEVPTETRDYGVLSTLSEV